MKRLALSCMVLGILALPVVASAVGTRYIGLRAAEDFKGGQLEGVSVDSSGTIRAGFNLGKIEVPEASSVWAALSLGKDKLLLATGHEGKLIEVSGGTAKEVAKADTMVLTSITRAFGTILVGSLPKATLYEYRGGKLERWLAIEGADHIFALAYDEKAQALYAATGPEGKLFRITKDKKAQVYLDAEEEHLMSVEVGRDKVYTGGGDKAKLYEVTGPGRANVLFDFGMTEVRAIRAAANGEVFAIANEVSGRSFPSSGDKDDGAKTQSKTKGKGKLYRFDASGAPEQLIYDEDDYFVSLDLDKKGRPHAGTGVEGRLYTVDDQHNSVLIADTEERQVSVLLLDSANEQVVISSDPVVVHPVRGIGGPDALWTSKPIDLGIRARFGRLEWTSVGKVALSSRSGNTAEPDDTWSLWSADMNAPGEVKSPRARFVQLRARFGEADATLSEVVLPFVTDNLRAVVTKIEAKTASAGRISSPDGKVQASGGPITQSAKAEVELDWNVDNPDNDPLRFRLKQRMVGTDTWFDILEPHEQLTKTSYTWNTEDMPEGRYWVKVSATDEGANPPESVTRHELSSNVFIVDNTPPEIDGLALAGGRRIRGIALDGVGPIARIEFSVVGTDDWVVVAPSDGLLDETSEAFEFDASAATPTGPALLSVRVYDSENNVVVRSIALR